MYKIKKVFSFVIFICFIVILTACGSASEDLDTMSNSKSSGYTLQNSNVVLTAADTSANTSETASSQTSQTTSATTSEIQQMLIYKGDLNISTDYFDDTFNIIKGSLATVNGYVVSQEDRSGDYANRFTTLQVRIPSEHFFTWVDGIEALPNTKVTKHIFTEDVSEEFVDLKAREKAKQVVIDKYIEYMQLATTADELIRYTNELATLQEEIESVQARIRYLSNQVSYSTLTIIIKETKQSAFLSELQIGSKLKSALQTGFSGSVSVFAFLISSIIILIPFIIFGLCIWAIVYFITRYFKRHTAKRINNQPINEPNNQPYYTNQVNNDGNDDSSKEDDK